MSLATLFPWLFLAAGIAALGAGAAWLVDGASRLALRLGISPMVSPRQADILLIGWSMGGGVAVDLAANDGAPGLVLASTFTSQLYCRMYCSSVIMNSATFSNSGPTRNCSA